jgi:precorrin-6B methylase 2
MTDTFNFIYNPETGRNLSLSNRLGKQILNRYSNSNRYDKIVNPKTKRYVSVSSKLGKQILKNYEIQHQSQLSQTKSIKNKQKGGSISVAKLLEQTYTGVNGYAIPKQEQTLVNIKGSSVYGEITHIGMKSLLKHLNLTSQDTFCDLGSGTGRVCLQAALESPVGSVKGVELSRTRHTTAMTSLNKIKSHSNYRNNVQFIQQDMTTTNLSDVSVIYMNSVCYNGESMSKLHTMFGNLGQLPRLRLIATFQNFNGPPVGFKWLKDLQVKCTWATNVSVHLYERM